MTLKRAYLFDSHALLRFFQAEAGYEKVLRLLEQIRKSEVRKYLNVINLGEIIYSTKREFGDQKKIEVLAHIERLNFIILPVPNSLVFQAAEYKAQFSISYADCFALASAIEHKAAIVTGDPEFKKVAHLADVVWV
jgi:ribonuclease VapC